jgi:diguanylate cyclase (GGDEF)-like protein/PAS domain S-box-containing protein
MTTPLLVQEGRTIEVAAESLLREHPEALVCGLSTNGLIVPIPQAMVLRGQTAIEGRAVIDSVVAADRNTVVDLWQRVQHEGSVRGTVRLLSKPSRWVTIYFLDLRHLHEILLCAIVPSEQVAEDEGSDADELPPAAPRFCCLTEDGLGKVLDCDVAFVQMFGYTAQEVIGESVLDQIHPEDQGRVVEGWMAMLATHRDQQTRLRRKRKDGSWLWVDTTVHNFLNEPGRNHVLVEIIDVSAEMVAQEALQEREELLRRLIDAMPDGLLQSDTDRDVIYHNARLVQILHGTSEAGPDGLASAEAAGADEGDQLVPSAGALLSTLTEEAMSVFDAALGRVLDDGIDQDVEVDFVLPSGKRRRALMSVRALLRQSGEVSGAITSVCDVTDSTRVRNELERRASFDALTSAHNRRSILGALQSELERDDSARTAVIYVDLDGFKAVNDTLGHAAGDELLVLIAERLKKVGRGDDAVGRLGGDEFLMLLRDVPGAEVAMDVARRISECVGSVFTLSCGPIELRASLGVACAEARTTTAEALVERADAAMYRSKHEGHGLPSLEMDAV